MPQDKHKKDLGPDIMRSEADLHFDAYDFEFQVKDASGWEIIPGAEVTTLRRVVFFESEVPGVDSERGLFEIELCPVLHGVSAPYRVLVTYPRDATSEDISHVLFGQFASSLGGVCWDSLHSQKQGLLSLATFLKEGAPAISDWGHVVNGIIGFIDALQDDASDKAGLWKFPVDPDDDNGDATIVIQIAGVDMRVNLVIDKDGKPTGLGAVESGMHETLDASTDDDEQSSVELYNASVKSIESTVLAHACAGVDVSTEAYGKGIWTAIEAISNEIG
jgi:hypothetical protein